MRDKWEKVEKKGIELPYFCIPFISACIKDKMSPKTIYAYEYEICKFFSYIQKTNRKEITLDDLKSITPEEIERYIYLYKEGNARAMTALRKLYKHFYINREIKTNPTLLIKTPAKKKRQTKKDSPSLIYIKQNYQTGESLSNTESKYRERTMYRDMLIMSLVLYHNFTPGKINEMNIHNLDTSKSYYGKGKDKIKLSKEEQELLSHYIYEERATAVDSEMALFIGSRTSRERLSTRSIEKIIKKYSGTNAGTIHQLIKDQYKEIKG